ncbi:hypothetical protein Tco_0653360 [Tanacetum coccineum]|uniref:Uncharacterized protein n=1 Tax=Tanacetum coccineum TaxID=301880 RepID=A0ABQ4X0Z0_9ASTR
MSNSNINLQTQSSNALHNAIMEAGSKDRPPMLALVPVAEGKDNESTPHLLLVQDAICVKCGNYCEKVETKFYTSNYNRNGKGCDTFKQSQDAVNCHSYNKPMIIQKQHSENEVNEIKKLKD